MNHKIISWKEKIFIYCVHSEKLMLVVILKFNSVNFPSYQLVRV